jgi:hypothetical protein
MATRLLFMERTFSSGWCKLKKKFVSVYSVLV